VVATWSWWWVASPLWISAGIMFVFCLIGIGFALLAALYKS
jgi:hypothetical protein